MKTIVLTFLRKIARLSFGVSLLSANTASMWAIYQPKEPKELCKLKKVK